MLESMQLSYCGEMVRTYDRDRFLISLFVPTRSREALWALFAFNLEIAKTREVVSDSNLGHIRLQWWRDVIKAVYDGGDIPQHEVVLPLAQAVSAYDLPREHFDALIYAREFDLEDVLPASLDGMMNYADFTHTPLLRLVNAVCGVDEEPETTQSIAIGYAMTGLLRSVPYHARQNRGYLPQDMMQKHDLTINTLFQKRDALKFLIKDVMPLIKDRLNIKTESKLTKAHRNLASLYTRQIEKNGFDLFSSALVRPPHFLALRLVLSQFL